MTKFAAVPGTVSSYRGWSCFQVEGGSWCATDGRYGSPASTPAMAGAPTLEAIKSRVDAYLDRQAGTPAR